MGDAPRDEGLRFDTRAVHAGAEPDPVYGAVNVPIYQTSTYVQDAVGAPRTWDYARGGNPTRAALETAIADLEGGAARVRVRVGDGGRVHAPAEPAAR